MRTAESRTPSLALFKTHRSGSTMPLARSGSARQPDTKSADNAKVVGLKCVIRSPPLRVARFRSLVVVLRLFVPAEAVADLGP
jgi:hypothetical protein